MKKNKLLSLSITALAPIAIPVMAISCGQVNQNTNIMKTGGYSDSMKKLADKTITLAGAWSDARFYAGDQAKNLVVVGATDTIPNDGVQVRPDMKEDDIAAIQFILIQAINASKDDKNQYYNDLTEIVDKEKNKRKSIFSIYNHDGYAKVKSGTQIKYDVEGNTKDSWSYTPDSGSEFFEVTKDSNGEVTAVTKKTKSEQFSIVLIPSGDSAKIQAVSSQLKKYFDKIGLDNIALEVSTDYNTAASEINKKTKDVAFLPVDTWAKNAPKSNFIIVAGRNVQITDPYKSVDKVTEAALNWRTNETDLIDALNNYKDFNSKNVKKELYIEGVKSNRPIAKEGYPEVVKKAVDSLADSPQGLPKVGFYRSYIYARKDSEIAKKIQDAIRKQGNDWKLNWSEVKSLITYGYTSNTSSASYIYPEAWFKKHFDGFEHF